MLCWNVYINNINNNSIELYNVFNHYSYVKALSKIFKQLNKMKKENSITLEYIPKDWSVKKFNDLAKELDFKLDNFFENEIKIQTQYYFWSKCEWEVVITSWPPYINVEDIQKLQDEVDNHDREWKFKQSQINIKPTIGEKIDVYDQLRANWDQFISYIKTHEKEIKKLANKNEKRYK